MLEKAIQVCVLQQFLHLIDAGEEVVRHIERQADTCADQVIWDIPGTEDLKPYINRKDKLGKWLVGTVGFAILSAVLSGIVALVLR